MKRPAALDGPPAFPHGLPFARPLTPPLEAVTARLRPSYEKGELTNGRLVRRLEEQAAQILGVPDVVAVSSCTAGLILTLQALCPSGPVLMPSFTFSASAHAVRWNGLQPVFAECDPHSFQLDMIDAETRIDEARAIFATHVFGAPCQAAGLEELGRSHGGLPVVLDAAHAFGSRHEGRPVGSFGDAEVFSLAPTKPVVAGEGGLVATRHRDLAERLRIGRDYGNPGDYDPRFAGLNARMSEFHAAVALESLALLDEHLRLRREAAERYRSGLADLPGIATQVMGPGDTSTYTAFSIVVDPNTFGLPRDLLVRTLAAEGIDTRRYFDPPLHRQQAYTQLLPQSLPVTEDLSRRIVNLPMFGRLPLHAVDQVVECVHACHVHAEEIADAFADPVNAALATPGT